MATLDDVVNRLRAEFLEMPGLRLTPAQVQRLCGLDKTLCQLGLDSLVETKFLDVRSDRVYARTIEAVHVWRELSSASRHVARDGVMTGVHRRRTPL